MVISFHFLRKEWGPLFLLKKKEKKGAGSTGESGIGNVYLGIFTLIIDYFFLLFWESNKNYIKKERNLFPISIAKLPRGQIFTI